MLNGCAFVQAGRQAHEISAPKADRGQGIGDRETTQPSPVLAVCTEDC